MDSGDEDELTTGSRDFYKMREKLFKAGYVEGATTAEEKAHEVFDPHQLTTHLAVYTELGKLMGVVEAAISISPDSAEDTPLHTFLAKLNHFALNLRVNPGQEPPSWDEVKGFVHEFKTICPDAAQLLETLFSEREDALRPEGGGGCGNGDSSCKCINGIAVDLNKLSF